MRRLVLIVVLVLLTFTGTWSDTPRGLLLGLRDASSHYRTLWVYPGGTLELPDIVVPRETGFWHVGVRRLKEADWQEDVLFALPAAKAPYPAFTIGPNGSAGALNLQILFVGPRGISVVGDSGGMSPGAAHPWSANFLEFHLLDDLTKDLTIQEVLGDSALRSLKEASRSYLKTHPDQQERLEDESRPDHWGLIRRGGAWVVRGLLDYNYEVNRGAFAHFDVPVAPGSKLVGPDRLQPSWDKVSRRFPDAVDAFSSADGGTLGVLTPQRLIVVRGGHFDNPAASRPLHDGGEAAVMIQWAEGSYVDAWTRTLRDLSGTR